MLLVLATGLAIGSLEAGSGKRKLKPVLASGGPGAATALETRADCDPARPSRAVALFRWTPAAKPGTEQHIVVALHRKALDEQQFEISDPLPADRASLQWDRLHGQAIHYWRVMTRHAEGWIPSEPASFEGPTCVADPTGRPPNS